jgi:hypothetical protein
MFINSLIFNISQTISWDVTPFSVVDCYQYFRRICTFILYVKKLIILKMVSAYSSEILVTIY